MRYSVIIPSYNSQGTICACLTAVTRQNFDEPYEILVVDSSQDATSELIQQHFPQVRLISRPQRTDAGTARNIGIEHAQGDILGCIDADCLAAPDWLDHIARRHAAGYDVAGGAVLNGNPESVIGWAGYLAEFREFFPFRPGREVSHVATCNISYNRRIFEQFGFFPPDFYPQEDLVFHQRLREHNVRIYFDPAMQVAHINRTSFAQFCRHQYRIGRITAEVLKCFPDLPGSRLARSRLLTLCAAPALPVIKVANTFRATRMAPDYGRSFRRAAPLLLLGLWVFWGSGFVRGAFLPQRSRAGN